MRYFPLFFLACSQGPDVYSLAQSSALSALPGSSIATIAPRYIGDAWQTERDDLNGSFFAVRPEGFAKQVKPASEERILARAARELDALGIGPNERGPPMYRKLYAQDREREGVAAPRLARHKVFVERTINGVRVQSHRLVLSLDDEDTVSRVLAQWPRLATSGHKLRSPLSEKEIALRVEKQLALEQVTGTEKVTRLEYVPAVLADGSAQLELMAATRVRDAGMETREVLTAIDAE